VANTLGQLEMPNGCICPQDFVLFVFQLPAIEIFCEYVFCRMTCIYEFKCFKTIGQISGAIGNVIIVVVLDPYL